MSEKAVPCCFARRAARRRPMTQRRGAAQRRSNERSDWLRKLKSRQVVARAVARASSRELVDFPRQPLFMAFNPSLLFYLGIPPCRLFDHHLNRDHAFFVVQPPRCYLLVRELVVFPHP